MEQDAISFLPITARNTGGTFSCSRNFGGMNTSTDAWRQETITGMCERMVLSIHSADELQNVAQSFILNGYGKYVKEIVLDMSMLRYNGRCQCGVLDESNESKKINPLLNRHSSAPQIIRRLPKWKGILPRRYNSVSLSDARRSPALCQSLSKDLPPSQTTSIDNSTLCIDCARVYSVSQSIVAILQTCTEILALEIDFKGIPFNMSHGANHLFVHLLTTTRFRLLESLTLRDLTRLCNNTDLNSIWAWMASLEISHIYVERCLASFFSREFASLVKSRRINTLISVKIVSLIVWNPVNQADVEPDFSWLPSSVTQLSVIDSPEWLHQENSLAALAKQLPNLYSLHLSIRLEASCTATFFVLTHDSASPPNMPCVLDHGLVQVLQHCHSLQQLTVDGFPTLTDHIFYAILDCKDIHTPSVPDLAHLRLSRNKGLTGSFDVCRRLIDSKHGLAHSSIDLTGCVRLNPEFVHCVALTAGPARVKW